MRAAPAFDQSAAFHAFRCGYIMGAALRAVATARYLSTEGKIMDRFQQLIELFAPAVLAAAGVPITYTPTITAAVIGVEQIAGASGADKKARAMDLIQREVGLAEQNPAATVQLASSAVDTLIGLVKFVRSHHG